VLKNENRVHVDKMLVNRQGAKSEEESSLKITKTSKA
jgi:hypothetical protein